MPNSQSIELYLAQIERELRDLPPQARADEMREIEAHLSALIEARSDVAGVLAQFGKPRKVGRDLRRAWERKQPEALWRVVLALIGALGFQSLAIYLLFSALLLDEKYGVDAQLQGIFSHSAVGFIYLSLAVLCYLSFCLISGLVIGAVSPKRGHWIIAAYFLSILAMLSSEAFGRGFSAYDNVSGDQFSILWWIMSFHILSTLLVLYGTRLGARYNRKRHARIASAN